MRRSARAMQDVKMMELDRDVVMAALAVGILLLGALTTYVLHQQGNVVSQQKELDTALSGMRANQKKNAEQQVQLEKLEERDRIAAYRAAYRFCTRINVDRAALQSLVIRTRNSQRSDPRARRFARAYLRKLQSKEGTPILDCAPNVVGGPAKYQSPRKQLAFVRRWDKGKLTPAEIGICKIRIGSLTDPKICEK